MARGPQGTVWSINTDSERAMFMMCFMERREENSILKLRAVYNQTSRKPKYYTVATFWKGELYWKAYDPKQFRNGQIIFNNLLFVADKLGVTRIKLAPYKNFTEQVMAQAKLVSAVTEV